MASEIFNCRHATDVGDRSGNASCGLWLRATLMTRPGASGSRRLQCSDDAVSQKRLADPFRRRNRFAKDAAGMKGVDVSGEFGEHTHAHDRCRQPARAALERVIDPDLWQARAPRPAARIGLL